LEAEADEKAVVEAEAKAGADAEAGVASALARHRRLLAWLADASAAHTDRDLATPVAPEDEDGTARFLLMYFIRCYVG
jgi:hypothetical protein